MTSQKYTALFRMNFRTGLILISIGLLCFSCINKDRSFSGNDKLWYTYPAKYWNSQALHLGNGYLGASLYGGIEQEVLTLTEESIWTGGPANGNWGKAGVNPKAKKALPLIRESIIHGNIRKADSLLTNDFFGSSELFGNFTTVGDLKIDFLYHSTEPKAYRRSLDLANSLATVQYKINNSFFMREYFCSYPDRILAMKFTSDRPAHISFDLFMDVMQDSSVIEISDNTYRVKGFINENLRPFQVLIYVKNTGGKTYAADNKLAVRGADAIEIYLTIATDYQMKYPDYKGDEPGKITDGVIQKIVNQNFDYLKERHVTDYKSLYDRVVLNIKGDKAVEKLPTNERFQRLKSGGADPGYKVLAFNLGRYMIISSSRENTLPANLQGVWNAFRIAPWAGNYQSNINLQEIYWSCGPVNLIECQQAYINWIENLAVSGHEIARRVYGTNGWVSHTTGNIWGHAAPVGCHPWAMFPVGAAWHCQHVWDQYAFTQDREYLQKQAYPLLKDAAIFWLENLIPFKGFLISAPSVSAEHGALMTENGLNPAYHDFESDKYSYSLPGVYQDIEIIWDLFTNTSEAARILGDNEFADSLVKIRGKLLPLKIGKYGHLQEWYDDIDNPDCHHRHIAHMYALCPGRQIHPTITPELAEAAKKSLNMRGDGRFLEQEMVSGGNWARAYRMWCWTRLMDGNRANKIMTEMLTEEGFENVLTFQHIDYHWGKTDFYKKGELYCHFQLDGSASVPGCIAEMLLQSHLNTLHLLPALPDELNTGSIKGIKARGGYTVDMEWKNGELVKANIYAKIGNPMPIVRLKEEIINLEDFKKIKIIVVD